MNVKTPHTTWNTSAIVAFQAHKYPTDVTRVQKDTYRWYSSALHYKGLKISETTVIVYEDLWSPRNIEIHHCEYQNLDHSKYPKKNSAAQSSVPSLAFRACCPHATSSTSQFAANRSTSPKSGQEPRRWAERWRRPTTWVCVLSVHDQHPL